MIVKDAKLLKSMRGAGQCELCGKLFSKREVHHALSKGAGGSDIRENLVSVGPHDTPWICQCHRLAHDGKIPRRCVLAVIALREGLSIEEIEEKVYSTRRVPK